MSGLTPYYDFNGASIYNGDVLDVLRTLPDQTFSTCVTSPPYFGLRDYGVAGQIGLEPTPDTYVARLVEVFREVRRVLKDDGTCWLNIGDSYAPNWSSRRDKGGGGLKNEEDAPRERWKRIPGFKPKDLLGIPWMLAFALRADGWYLRQDIIWHKPNPMPESVTDRCTKSHEYIFLMSKSERYYYESIREPLTRPDEGERKTPAKFGGALKFAAIKDQSRLHSGNEYVGTDDGMRNRRSVWTVATNPYPGAHFATFPPELIKPCIMAGSRIGDSVLEPFCGSGTTLMVSRQLGRKAVGIELNHAYCELAADRIRQGCLFGSEVA